MADRQSVQTRAPWEPIVGYSRAVRVGPFVAVTGTTALDAEGRLVGKGDAALQTRQCLANIGSALRRLGVRLEDVVRTRMFVTDIAQWEAIGRVHGEVFGAIRPATTMVQVSRLIDADMLVEIEADAIVAADVPGITVREVRESDVPAVVEHVARTLAEFGLAFGEGAKSDDELRSLPSAYTDRRGRFWVAHLDGKLVGTAGIVEVGPSTFELRKMYLTPECRGKGVGKRLLDLVLVHARSHGARALVLDTVEEMADAIAFYERNGFVRDDRFKSASRCTRGYRRDLEGT